MAKVKDKVLCPRCGSSALDMDKYGRYSCRSCLPKDEPRRAVAFSVKPLSIQKRNLEEQIADTPETNGITFSDISLSFSQHLRGLDDRTRRGIMTDALCVMSELVTSNSDPENRKALVQLAEKIGALGKAIKDYVAAGGQMQARATPAEPIKLEDDEEQFRQQLEI
jgi:hypothetical protein